MTLVGRGPIVIDATGDYNVPTFIDADGNRYVLSALLTNEASYLDNDGFLTIARGEAIAPVGVGVIIVDNPSDVNNSTNALTFAVGCGYQLSTVDLLFFEDENSYNPGGNRFECVDGYLTVNTIQQGRLFFWVDEGFKTERSGSLGCSYEPLDTRPQGMSIVTAAYLTDLHADNLVDRQMAHNAWLLIALGVPASVFETE